MKPLQVAQLAALSLGDYLNVRGDKSGRTPRLFVPFTDYPKGSATGKGTVKQPEKGRSLTDPLKVSFGYPKRERYGLTGKQARKAAKAARHGKDYQPVKPRTPHVGRRAKAAVHAKCVRLAGVLMYETARFEFFESHISMCAAITLDDWGWLVKWFNVLCAETNHIPSDKARLAAAYLERRGK